MIFKREIGRKGQVVIPVDVRRLLGVKSGQEIMFDVRGESVAIVPAQNPERAVDDFLNTPKLKKKLSPKQLKEVIMSQYEIS